MADTTTDIADSIQQTTGVTTADSKFIESAQRFVVHNVPKQLLHFAATKSGAIVDDDGYSIPNGDTILSVEREGCPADIVPFGMSKFIADSTSLHRATEKFPKYYINAGKVFIKPAPEAGGSDDGYVTYVNYSNIGDTSDLRSIIVHHACANEFSKITSNAISKARDLIDDSSGLSQGEDVEYWLNDEDIEMIRVTSEVAAQELKRAQMASVKSGEYFKLAMEGIQAYVAKYGGGKK